jgi:hypothetical protein
MMILRSLILMEAPKPKSAAPAIPADGVEHTIEEPPQDEPPSSDEGSDDALGGSDSDKDKGGAAPEDADPAADDGNDPDADTDATDDADASDAASDETDPVADRLKRTDLFDAITEIREQCKVLVSSAAFLADRTSDETARRLASKARSIAAEAERQCGILHANFSDFGYERVRAIYLTVRERVSAVAEVLKHVIDGDEDFRQTDSGSAETSRSDKQGRGRGGM